MAVHEVERYGIYFADLDPVRGSEIAKTRPVVVVSLDTMNRHLETVVVCPLTGVLHPLWRSRVPCKCARRKAEVAVDQIRTLSKQSLVRRVDRLTPAVIRQVRQLITEMYGE